MKKIATIMASLLCMVILFTACSSDETSDETITTQTQSTTDANLTYVDENTGTMTKIGDDFYWAEVDVEADTTYYGLYYKSDDNCQLVVKSYFDDFYDVGDKIFYLGYTSELSSVDKNDFDNVEQYATSLNINSVINIVDDLFYCYEASSYRVVIDTTNNTWSEIDYVDIPKSDLDADSLIELYYSGLSDYDDIVFVSDSYFRFAENGDYIDGRIPIWVYEEFDDEWSFGLSSSDANSFSQITLSTVEELEDMTVEFYNTYLKSIASLTTQEVQEMASDEDSILVDEIFEMVEQLQNSDIFDEYYIDNPDGFCVGYKSQTAQDYILQDDSNVTYLYFTDDGYVECEKPEEFTQGNTVLENGDYLVFAPYYTSDDVEIDLKIAIHSCANLVVAIFE